MKTILTTVCFCFAMLFANLAIANIENMTASEFAQKVASQQAVPLSGVYDLTYDLQLEDYTALEDPNDPRESRVWETRTRNCKFNMKTSIDPLGERCRSEETVADFGSFSKFNLTPEEKAAISKKTVLVESGVQVEVFTRFDGSTQVALSDKESQRSYNADILDFGGSSQFVPDPNAALSVSINGATGDISYKEDGVDYNVQTFPDYSYALRNVKVVKDGKINYEITAGNYIAVSAIQGRSFPRDYQITLYLDGKMDKTVYKFHRVEKSAMFDNKVELPKGAIITRTPVEVNGELVGRPNFVILETGRYSIADILKLAEKKSVIEDSKLKQKQQERNMQQ